MEIVVQSVDELIYQWYRLDYITDNEIIVRMYDDSIHIKVMWDGESTYQYHLKNINTSPTEKIGIWYDGDDLQFIIDYITK